MISYCGRFETVLAKLRAVDYMVPDDQKFLIFIKSLPKDRQEFCHTWRMVYDMGSIDELVSSVKARYHADKMLEVTSKEEQVALFSSSSKSKNFKKRENFSKKRVGDQPRSSKEGEQKPDMICRYCNKSGHKWRYCRKLQEMMGNPNSDQIIIKTSKKPDEIKDTIFMAVNKSSLYAGKKNLWVADSGANCHVTPYLDLISGYQTFKTPKEILTGGRKRYSHGFGSVVYENISGSGVLKDVLYIPDFPTNIFSLDKVINLGFDIFVDSYARTVQII